MPTNKQEIIRQVNEAIARLKNKEYKPPFKADFAEVVIEDGKNGESRGESIRPLEITEDERPYDPVRDRFSQMKQMAGEIHKNMLFAGDYRERLFYKQAVFMADFEDDYESSAQFQMYFPTYQMMSYEQLRTYFTWRSRVRRGDIRRTDLSYVFLYIYELINNIGVSDGEDGLNKLLCIWKAFRKYTKMMDKYMAVWVRDYYVLNECRISFGELLEKEPVLQKYYSVNTGGLDYYNRLSVYNIKKSIFFTPENEKMLNECFDHIIKRLNGLLEKVNRNFNDLIFDRSIQYTWRPFASAVFYMRPEYCPKNPKTIKLTDEMIFYYKNGRWTYFRSGPYYGNAKFILGYIIKRMEQLLRRALKFKYKLTADNKKIDKRMLDRLLPGIGSKGFLTEIDLAVKEYYVNLKKTVVKVDERNLEKIRENALLIQEKLLVPEDEFDDRIDTVDNIQAPKNDHEDVVPEEEAMLPEEYKPTVPDAEPPAVARTGAEESLMPGDDTNPDVWSAFVRSLEPVELAALKKILEGATAKSLLEFAKACGFMPEVLLDGINQKALDITGDTILESADEISVYEEYIENLRKAVECEQ